MTVCTRINKKVKALFKRANSAVTEHAATALSITQAIKSFLDTGVLDIVVLFTKTKADDIALARLNTALITAIDALQLVEGCKGAFSLKEKVSCLLEGLRLLSPHMRDAVLIKLANLLTAHLDGNRYKQNFYDALTQGLYSAEKE